MIAGQRRGTARLTMVRLSPVSCTRKRKLRAHICQWNVVEDVHDMLKLFGVKELFLIIAQFFDQGESDVVQSPASGLNLVLGDDLAASCFLELLQ